MFSSDLCLDSFFFSCCFLFFSFLFLFSSFLTCSCCRLLLLSDVSSEDRNERREVLNVVPLGWCEDALGVILVVGVVVLLDVGKGFPNPVPNPVLSSIV